MSGKHSTTSEDIEDLGTVLRCNICGTVSGTAKILTHIYTCKYSTNNPISGMDRYQMDRSISMSMSRSKTLPNQVRDLMITEESLLSVINNGSPESFENIQNNFVLNFKNIKYRGQHKYTIGEIKRYLDPKNKKWCTSNNIDLSPIPLSDDMIPKGRIGELITRDDRFTTNILAHLDALGDVNNTLFLNYTGHLSSFASALLSRQIDCVWKIPSSAVVSPNLLTGLPKINERLIEQLQDSVTSTLTPFTENLNSFGIVLEAPHGLVSTIDIKNLPIKAILDKLGITKIVIFNENTFPFQTRNIKSCSFSQEGFVKYVLSLGKETIIMGCDYE